MITKYSVTLIAAKSVQDSSGSLGPGLLSRVTELAFDITFSPGCTDGQVVIESAPDARFSGKWAIQETIDFAEANRNHHIAMTAEYMNLKARISKPILGGTVSVLVNAS